MFNIYELLIAKLPFEIIEKIDKIIQTDFFNKAFCHFKIRDSFKYTHNLRHYNLRVYFDTLEMSTNVYALDDIKVFFNKNNNMNNVYIKLPNNVIKRYVLECVDGVIIENKDVYI